MTLALALSLSGCTMLKPESWAKQIFSPSSVTYNAACDQGILEASGSQELKPIGRVVLSPKQGGLGVLAGYGQTHLICFGVGRILNRRPEEIPQFATEIRIQDASVKRDQIKLQVSLEQDGRELSRLEEAEITPEGNDITVYRFKRFNANQLAALDQADSFTIIVNRGLSEERYPINPTNLPGL